MIRPLSPYRAKASPGAPAVDTSVTLVLTDGAVYRHPIGKSSWRLTQMTKPMRAGPVPPTPPGIFNPLPPAPAPVF
jgi:hypothetical protein